jgi:hypothetical protein
MSCITIIFIILAILYMLLIWSLFLISKKQEPKPKYEGMEKRRRVVNE